MKFCSEKIYSVYKILLVCFTFICFESCVKEPTSQQTGRPDCTAPPQKHYIILQSFKFKQGTYWVFYDSITHTNDSLTIKYSPTTYSYIWNYCGDTIEHYDFQLAKYGIWQNNSNSDSYGVETNYVTLNRSSHYPSDYEIIYSDYKKNIDSLFIYNRYYQNIKTYQRSNTNYTSKYYINANEGFLKMETFTASNQLVNNKVIIEKHLIR